MTKGSFDLPSFNCIFVRLWCFAKIHSDGAARNSELREQNPLAVVAAEPVVMNEELDKTTDGF